MDEMVEYQNVKRSDRAIARMEKYQNGEMSNREYVHDLFDEHYGSDKMDGQNRSDKLGEKKNVQ